MGDAVPSQFYSGLVAQLYQPLRSAVFDPEPYARFVARTGEPAIELGCGGGEPLLDLVARGLDVDGLDSSSDMLELCRNAARARALNVTLHHQTVEDMNLGRRYRSIYFAGPTFNLLPDDDTARRALTRIAAHLAPGGRALVPTFVPEPTRELGVARVHVADDGTELRVTAVAERRDDAARVQVTRLRYERIRGDRRERDERDWLLHWYSGDGFAELAAAAGLAVRTVGDGVYVLTGG